MFKNLTQEQKEERFNGLISLCNKINNKGLKNACISILNDYKEELFCRGAGHGGIEMNKHMAEAYIVSYAD